MEGKPHFPGQVVGYDNAQRMHVMRRGVRPKRWTPTWAMSNEKTRLVVYTYIWQYVKHTIGGKPKPGISLRELEKIATTSCREKIAKRMEYISPREQAIYGQHLSSTENGIAARATRLIYLCYRQGYYGSDAADTLGMSWASVRQLLHRLNIIARRLYPADCSAPHPSTKPADEVRASNNARHKRVPRKKVVKVYPELPPGERIIEVGFASSQVLEMAKLYNEGATCRQLSKVCGIPPSTLAWSFKRFNLVSEERKSKHSTPVASSEEMKELAYWRQHGATVKELADLVGVHERTMGARLWRMGVKKNA
jgi:transposase-like protein